MKAKNHMTAHDWHSLSVFFLFLFLLFSIAALATGCKSMEKAKYSQAKSR